MSYHDFYVEYDVTDEDDEIQTVRFGMSDRYGIELTCCRVAGWRLWATWGREPRDHVLLAGEFDNPKLRLYHKKKRIL